MLFTFQDNQLKFLLQKKKEEPYFDQLGLIGKLIYPNEETDQAMDKLLLSTIQTKDFYKKKLTAFTGLNRHPLGRVISIIYYGLIPTDRINRPLSDELSWHSLDEAPDLSYDHNDIFQFAVKRLRKGLLRHPLVFELLPLEFTIPEVISIYKQVFSNKIDSSNFSRMIQRSQLISPLNKFSNQHKMGRPARLYTFNRSKYKKENQNKIRFNF